MRDHTTSSSGESGARVMVIGSGGRRLLAIAFGCLALAWAAGAEAARLALVVGNANYQTVGRLKNPGADAELIAGKLRGLDFDVSTLLDGTKAGLSTAIKEFGRKVTAAGPGSTVLVFYAGHGIQDKNTNYIVPVDADLRVLADLATEALTLDTLVRLLEQPNVGTGVVILDACRDNPLPSNTRSMKRGLAIEERNGLYVVLSTDPGNVALDGDGQNSPFAEALAAEIAQPGVDLDRMFKRVRLRVFDATNGQQKPFMTDGLLREAYLAGAPLRTDGTGQSAAAPVPDTPDPDIEYLKAVELDTAEAYEKLLRRFPDHPKKKFVLSQVQRKAEEGLWKRAETIRGRPEEVAVLDRLISAFDGGIYTERARERKDAILREEAIKKAATPDLSERAQRDFDAAKRVNTVDAWTAFLAAHPNGSLATLARYNLAVLAAATVTPRSDPVRPAPVQYHYVTGLDPNGNNWLALRDAPELGNNYLHNPQMGPGTLLKVLGRSGDWLNVELQSGKTGWASSRYVACCRTPEQAPVAPTPPTATVQGQYHYITGVSGNAVDGWAALRTEPRFGNQYIEPTVKMWPGTLIRVHGRDGEWLNIELPSGKRGWANSRFVACCRSN